MNTALGYPHEERTAGRPTSRPRPLYDLLVAAGAHMGFSAGWEVPLWFAGPGSKAACDVGRSLAWGGGVPATLHSALWQRMEPPTMSGSWWANARRYSQHWTGHCAGLRGACDVRHFIGTGPGTAGPPLGPTVSDLVVPLRRFQASTGDICGIWLDTLIGLTGGMYSTSLADIWDAKVLRS